MIENNDEKLRGIFSLNGIKNTNQIKLVHKGNIKLKQHEYVPDELLNQYKIADHVIGEIYICNITDIYLMITKRIPIMYLSVIYEQPLRKVLLYRAYLQFTITSEVNDVKDLLEKPISGKFELEIDIQNNKKIIDDAISLFPGNEKMVKKFTAFTQTEEMKELINSLVDEVKERLREEYKDEMDFYTPPKNVISLRDFKL